MISPLEFISKYITPNIRGLVAIELYERGYSQSKIASLLGVSQPMILKYLRAGRDKLLRQLESIGINRDEAMAIANSIALRLSESRIEALTTLALVELSILTRDIICNAYIRVTGISDACRVLSIYYEPRDPYIAEVEEAYKILSSIRGIADFIPEVGSNIVLAKPNARSIIDTIGYPGRIIKLDRSILAIGRPSYGGSRFMATIILEAMKIWSMFRAIIALKRNEKLLESAHSLNIEVCSIGPFKDPDSYFKELRLYLEKCGKPPRVIDDTGGPGLEPILYVLGVNALDASRVAKLIIENSLRL